MRRHRGGCRVAALLAVALAASVGGCAWVGLGVESPDVTIAGIEPLEGGVLEQRMAVTLRVRNPNRFELAVEGVDCTLEVNGARLARGLGNEHVAIPALGEGTIQLVASTTLLDVARQVLRLNERRELAWEIHGVLYLEGVRRSVSFEASNRLGPEVFGAPANGAANP